MDEASTRPVISLLPGRSKRVEQGHPWIYSNEVQLDTAAKSLEPGATVTVATHDGRRLGVATFNAHTLIALRLLDRDASRPIDASFFSSRITRALEIRNRLFPSQPYYRLIHAEADGLPGLIIDRYGDALVCQLNTAGMVKLSDALLRALDSVLKPAVVLFRNDATARQLENLADEARVVKGEFKDDVRVVENGTVYLAGLAAGQKTGWFFDQRDNRARVAGLAPNAKVLDVYSYSGGFGILAARQGAGDVLLVDRSADALKLATAAAALNEVQDRVSTRQGDAFEVLTELAAAKQRFDLVVLDPPAFIRSKKDLGPGSRAYRKLVRLGASVTQRRGYLFVASCSHNLDLEMFAEAVKRGLNDAGRPGRLLATGFAGPDHPVHPALPESAYLKSNLLALD